MIFQEDINSTLKKSSLSLIVRAFVSFDNKNVLFNCIFLFIFSFFVIDDISSQSADSTEEYYSPFSKERIVSVAEKIKVTNILSRRLTYLQKRVQKANNDYLHLFMKEEDALLHSLCVGPSKEFVGTGGVHMGRAHRAGTNKTDQTSIAGNIITPKNDPSIEKGNYILSDPKNGALEIWSQVPKNSISSEMKAEALLTDAWYAFRRFENICELNSNKPLQTKLSELENADVLYHYIDTVSELGSTNKANLLKARRQLLTELKRTELIKSYIKERRQFLYQTLAGMNGSYELLLPINKCAYYYDAQMNELFTVFKYQNRVDKFPFSILSPMNSTDDFQLSENLVQSNLISKSHGPKYVIGDLVNKSPNLKSHIINLVIPELMNGVINKDFHEIDNNQLCSLPQLGTDSLMNNEISELANKNKLSGEQENRNEWKPNLLKTKRLIDRVNYGGNVQFVSQYKYLPRGLNFSGFFSFQLTQKSNLGVGFALRQPFPSDILNDRTVKVPPTEWHGVRSFVDYKLMGSLFIQGGYERTYSRSSEILVQNEGHSFAESAMIGIKYKYPVKNKTSRPTVELLYDALYRSNGQTALTFRVGVEFRSRHSLH